MQEIFTFVHPPLKHQAEELEISHAAMSRALFWEMGTGKSKVIIDTMAWLFLNGKIDLVIIIAKKGEYTNWKHVELPEHMPKELDYVCEVYRSGMRQAEKKAVKALATPSDKLRIICINVESMTAEGGVVARALTKTRRKGMMLVVDESTCIKSSKAARSKAVYELAAFASYRRILSGTPITRSPLDLWGQSLVLGRGLLGHMSLASFKGDYAVEETQYAGPQRSYKTIVGFKNLDRLTKVIKTFASIKERKECIDLPPKIYKKVVVQLTDRQEELYAQMRDEAIAELGDGTIVEAVNALGIISRLDQIACGQLRKPDQSFEMIDSNRPEALMSLLEYSQVKGIIWCNYRGLLQHLYERIAQEYGPDKVGRYYGGVPDDEREFTVKAFQDPEHKLTWIVANQQSLGYGRTLTTGKENYYFSNGYNLEHRLQSEDRTMRIGQTDSVLYTDFYSPNTINERVMQLLRQKRNLASEILGTTLGAWI